MTKRNRVVRSREDLKEELRDQLDLLRVSCTAYDNGVEAAGKTIATILRVLLYSHKQSRGLLDQLGYRSGKFISSCEDFDESNIAPRPTILTMNVTKTAVKWEPRACTDPHCRESRKLPFTEWWSETIVLDGKRRRFTRMDLVMHVADTDGGAHVDPGLDDSYMDLTRGNSIGYKFGDQAIPFVGRPVLACMRQIAHEVIATLLENVPELGERVLPVVPPYTAPITDQAGEGQKIQVSFTLPDELKGMKNLRGTATLSPVKKIN